jgi:hypothetical protein
VIGIGRVPSGRSAEDMLILVDPVSLFGGIR